MGKITRLREAQAAARNIQHAATLRRHNAELKQAEITLEQIDLQNYYKLDLYSDYFIRSFESWDRPRTKDTSRRMVLLARHLFAKYPVPQHLEAAAFDATVAPKNDLSIINHVLWYICVAQGGSLYKEHLRGTLSRAEVHYFLSAPPRLSYKEAIVFAVARAQGAAFSIAHKIACTKLSEHAWTHRPTSREFWFSVVHFFVRHPIGGRDINNLVDYIRHAHTQDDKWSIKGRSISSLSRQMKEWHRNLSKQRYMGAAAWAGMSIPDGAYSVDLDGGKIRKWFFRQIKTGQTLFDEGSRMRHCVTMYRDSCVQGNTFIWALQFKDSGDIERKALTIRISKGQIVEYAGFANRLATPGEKSIVKRWAQEHNIGIAARFL